MTSPTLDVKALAPGIATLAPRASQGQNEAYTIIGG
jgi:hypothetical protein